MFYHVSRGIRTLVHGDDYASVGSLSELLWLRSQLDNRFEMKTVLVGHSAADKVESEGNILNRVIRGPHQSDGNTRVTRDMLKR